MCTAYIASSSAVKAWSSKRGIPGRLYDVKSTAGPRKIILLSPMFSTIAVIGAGVMGSLLVEKCVSFFSDAKIIVCDHSLERLSALQLRFPNITVTTDAARAAGMADCIFLAVKPQSFMDLAGVVSGSLTSDKLCISVMAGVPVKKIVTACGATKVIRTMPNTPARIGKGVIGMFANGSVSSDEQSIIKDFFQHLGLVFHCEQEDEVDKLTAISGSGPAYVYYTMECLVASAKELGFSESQALQIVKATFAGAIKLAENDDPANLRAQVTSKGGTTEAAIRVFDERDMKSIWQSAVLASYERATELGKV